MVTSRCIDRVAGVLEEGGHSAGTARALAANTVRFWAASGKNGFGDTLRRATREKATAVMTAYAQARDESLSEASARGLARAEGSGSRIAPDEERRVAERMASMGTIAQGLLMSINTESRTLRTAEKFLGRACTVEEARQLLAEDVEICAFIVEATGYNGLPIRATSGTPGAFHGMHGVERAVRHKSLRQGKGAATCQFCGAPMPSASGPCPNCLKTQQKVKPMERPPAVPMEPATVYSMDNPVDQTVIVQGRRLEERRGPQIGGVETPVQAKGKPKGRAGQPVKGSQGFERLHPRQRAGAPGGGQFIQKGEGQELPYGSSRVLLLQQRLNELGHKADSDGKFGPQTEQALKDFQTKYGLEPTGVVDQRTLVTLRNPPPRTVAQVKAEEQAAAKGTSKAKGKGKSEGKGKAKGKDEPSAAEIESTRKLLADLGYDVGKSEGKAGGMGSVIREFQKRHKLRVTGKLDRRTLRAIERAAKSEKKKAERQGYLSAEQQPAAGEKAKGSKVREASYRNVTSTPPFGTAVAYGGIPPFLLDPSGAPLELPPDLVQQLPFDLRRYLGILKEAEVAIERGGSSAVVARAKAEWALGKLEEAGFSKWMEKLHSRGGEVARDAGPELSEAVFTERLHPRKRAGAPGGGQFIEKLFGSYAEAQKATSRPGKIRLVTDWHIPGQKGSHASYEDAVKASGGHPGKVRKRERWVAPVEKSSGKKQPESGRYEPTELEIDELAQTYIEAQEADPEFEATQADWEDARAAAYDALKHMDPPPWRQGKEQPPGSMFTPEPRRDEDSAPAASSLQSALRRHEAAVKKAKKSGDPFAVLKAIDDAEVDLNQYDEPGVIWPTWAISNEFETERARAMRDAMALVGAPGKPSPVTGVIPDEAPPTPETDLQKQVRALRREAGVVDRHAIGLRKSNPEQASVFDKEAARLNAKADALAEKIPEDTSPIEVGERVRIMPEEEGGLVERGVVRGVTKTHFEIAQVGQTQTRLVPKARVLAPLPAGKQSPPTGEGEMNARISRRLAADRAYEAGDFEKAARLLVRNAEGDPAKLRQEDALAAIRRGETKGGKKAKSGWAKALKAAQARLQVQEGEEDEMDELSEVKSSVYPGLDRSPRENWVDKAGGLPKYIERIAKHLHYEKGKPIGQAIAIAVNVVKKMCATGDVNFPGKQSVNPKSRAQACKAVAEWEKKKLRHALIRETVHAIERKPVPKESLTLSYAVRTLDEMREIDESVLSYEQRKKLPKGAFAIPEKAPGPGSYPIHDEAHARNALTRVAQHGSPSEKARVRAAVKARYPKIGKG